MSYRNPAVYQPGAIGFRVSLIGEIQCGELMDNMWDLNNIARFKILDAKSGKLLTKKLDACLAKSSTDSGNSPVFRTLDAPPPSKRPAETAEEGVHIVESWPSKDVVIVEEGGKPPVIGKVTKVCNIIGLSTLDLPLFDFLW